MWSYYLGRPVVRSPHGGSYTNTSKSSGVIDFKSYNCKFFHFVQVKRFIVCGLSMMVEKVVLNINNRI